MGESKAQQQYAVLCRDCTKENNEPSSPKRRFGFQNGDVVRATVPKGKYQGIHVGRVMTRASGYFDARKQTVRLLQRTIETVFPFKRAAGFYALIKRGGNSSRLLNNRCSWPLFSWSLMLEHLCPSSSCKISPDTSKTNCHNQREKWFCYIIANNQKTSCVMSISISSPPGRVE